MKTIVFTLAVTTSAAAGMSQEVRSGRVGADLPRAYCACVYTDLMYSAEREESTFLIFAVFRSYLHHTICYGQKQHMTVILNLY